MLYACYAEIRADVVLELAWRNNIIDNVMPFMIQTFREYDDKLQSILGKFEAQTQAAKEAETEEKKKQEADNAKAAQFVGIPNLGPSIQAPLAIMPPPMPGMANPMMYPGAGPPPMMNSGPAPPLGYAGHHQLGGGYGAHGF